MKNLQNLSEKIKKLRTSVDLSQERFGKKIGVSGKTVSAYETGRSIPPLHILEKISITYNAALIAVSNDKKNELPSKIETAKQVLGELEKSLTL